MSKSIDKEKEKRLLKTKLMLLLFKEAQKLIHYEYIYRTLRMQSNKLFEGEEQQITPDFRVLNQKLNKAICDMETSDAKCKRYEELLLKLKRDELE